MTTIDEELTATFIGPFAVWFSYAHEVARDAPALAESVLKALAGLYTRGAGDHPVAMTITRHDDAGSRYTVTARYARGRRTVKGEVTWARGWLGLRAGSSRRRTAGVG